MRSVTFVQDHRYDGGGVKGEARDFVAGRTYELPEPSAAHYVRQGRAVWAVGASTANAPPVAPPAPADKGMKPGQVRIKPAKKPGAAARPLEPLQVGSPSVAAEGKSSPP